jgi:hypothetical protein
LPVRPNLLCCCFFNASRASFRHHFAPVILGSFDLERDFVLELTPTLHHVLNAC